MRSLRPIAALIVVLLAAVSIGGPVQKKKRHSGRVHHARRRVPVKPLHLELKQLSLTPGSVRPVGLTGTHAQATTITTSNPQIAQARRSGDKVVIRAIGVGKATISVRYRTQRLAVAVVVAKPAAIFPQYVRAYVTGAPASKDTVEGAILYSVKNHVRGQLGADFQVVSTHAQPLVSGATEQFSVKTRATAAGFLPTEGYVYVQIVNMALAQMEESELWYCNDPESIRKLGGLFSANLVPNKATRLLYHHVNDSGDVLVLKVQVVNNSELPARLMIIPGDSKPHRDPVLAGFVAARQYMSDWQSGSGQIVTVPPHNTLPICIHRLWPEQTASGLCSLRLLSGGPDSVLVRVDARKPFAMDGQWTDAANSSTPWQIVGPQPISEFDPPARSQTDEIYPNPYEYISSTYDVGGKYTFIRIGSTSIERQDKEDALDGNFGVLYKIHATLNNPTDSDADVEVVFESSAGYAGALGILDGRFINGPLLAPKEEYRILKVHLARGTSRPLFFTTMPISGSSYPATITIRPIGSLARYSTAALGTQK